VKVAMRLAASDKRDTPRYRPGRRIRPIQYARLQ